MMILPSDLFSDPVRVIEILFHSVRRVLSDIHKVFLLRRSESHTLVSYHTIVAYFIPYDALLVVLKGSSDVASNL